MAEYPCRENQTISLTFSGHPPFGIGGPTTVISEMAKRGNPIAIRKTVLSRAYSDGVIAEEPGTAIETFAARWPRVTLDALRAVPAGRRDLAVQAGCYAQRPLLALRPRDALDRHLLMQIATTRGACP